MTELGKFGKLIGVKHPRDLRKLPTSDKVTPAPSKRPRADYRYGYSYEITWPWRGRDEWELCQRWYIKESARDSAMKAFERRASKFEWYRNIQKVDR